MDSNEGVVELARSSKRRLEGFEGVEQEEGDGEDAKRRRILEETRGIDADSEGSDDESSEEER